MSILRHIARRTFNVFDMIYLSVMGSLGAQHGFNWWFVLAFVVWLIVSITLEHAAGFDYSKGGKDYR